jgi:hypothetical protein
MQIRLCTVAKYHPNLKMYRNESSQSQTAKYFSSTNASSNEKALVKSIDNVPNYNMQ